jgi:uncharacterized protein (TIGR00645 family)
MSTMHESGRSLLKSAGHVLEAVIFASRWLLVPLYVGLIACLFALLFKFFQILFAFIVVRWSTSNAILGLLSLINVTLVGSLVLIVVVSGYSNFVSRIDLVGRRDSPEGMLRINFAGLKQMVFAPIVALSAIQVLEALININSNLSTEKLAWLIGIQLVFAMTILLLALSDRISGNRY